MPDQFEKMYKVPNPKYSFDIAIFVSKFKIELFIELKRINVWPIS